MSDKRTEWKLAYEVLCDPSKNKGNRVLLPNDVLTNLAKAKKPKPYFFHIRAFTPGGPSSSQPQSGNSAFVVGVRLRSENAESKSQHSQDQAVGIPQWLVSSLQLTENSQVLVSLVEDVREATSLAIRPVKEAFKSLLEYSGGLGPLQQGLQHYPVLKKGMVIPIRVYDRTYDICIDDITATPEGKDQGGERKGPDGVCSLIDPEDWLNTGKGVLQVEILSADDQTESESLDVWSPTGTETAQLKTGYVWCLHEQCGVQVVEEAMEEHKKEHRLVLCECGVEVMSAHIDTHRKRKCPSYKRCYHCQEPQLASKFQMHMNRYCKSNEKPCWRCGEAVPVSELFVSEKQNAIHNKKCSNVCTQCGKKVLCLKKDQHKKECKIMCDRCKKVHRVGRCNLPTQPSKPAAQEKGWKCNRCRYTNKDTDRKTCETCGLKR